MLLSSLQILVPYRSPDLHVTVFQPLKPLPYPVYFVRNDPDLCEELATVESMPAFEHFYRPASGGSSSWIVQTYLQLKLRGLDVRLVPHYVPDEICVVAREEMMQLIKQRWTKELPFHSYLVVCQQDRPRPEICEHRIVQNFSNVLDSTTDHFLPHWPQPELRSRDLSRGTRIENLAFKGRWYYIPDPYKTPEFLSQLHGLGIKFSVGENNAVNLIEWADYSTTDVLLAVRERPGRYLTTKPPTKLINAWFAGCPALLGPESAFQDLRRSELDYLEINSPADVISCLKRLREDPLLYQAMVENGWQRAKEFVPERIANQWRDLLADTIAAGYRQWRQQPLLWKRLGSPLQFGQRLIIQEHELRSFYSGR